MPGRFPVRGAFGAIRGARREGKHDVCGGNATLEPHELERRDSRAVDCRLRSSRRRSFGVRIPTAACSQAIRPSTARAQGSLANSPSAPRNSTQHAQCLDKFDRSLRIAVAESPTIRCNMRREAPCPHRDRRPHPIRFAAVRDRKSLPAPLGIGPLRRRNGVSMPMEKPRSEGLGGFWPIEHQMSE